jgi:hypothetical protein
MTNPTKTKTIRRLAAVAFAGLATFGVSTSPGRGVSSSPGTTHGAGFSTSPGGRYAAVNMTRSGDPSGRKAGGGQQEY